MTSGTLHQGREWTECQEGHWGPQDLLEQVALGGCNDMNQKHFSNKESLAYRGRGKILMGRMALIPGVFLITATSCTKSANALSDKWSLQPRHSK